MRDSLFVCFRVLPACGNMAKAMDSTGENICFCLKTDQSSVNWEHFSQVFPVRITLTCMYDSQRSKEDRGWRIWNYGPGKEKECAIGHFLGVVSVLPWWLRLSDCPCVHIHPCYCVVSIAASSFHEILSWHKLLKDLCS